MGRGRTDVTVPFYKSIGTFDLALRTRGLRGVFLPRGKEATGQGELPRVGRIVDVQPSLDVSLASQAKC